MRLKKTILLFSVSLLIATVGFISFVSAEELSAEVELDAPASLEETINKIDNKTALDILEKTAPVTLVLSGASDLTSGSEIKVKANFSIIAVNNSSNFNFKWVLRLNGLEQEVSADKQGEGKDIFSFNPSVSGDYEVKAQVTDRDGNMRESEFLSIPVGNNILMTFKPLKPTRGQMVTVNAAVFVDGAKYEWFLDGKKMMASGPELKFEVTKMYEQDHKVKVSVNGSRLSSNKEILITVYRPEVVLVPELDNNSIAIQSGESNKFLVKGDGPIVVNAKTVNFIEPEKATYSWSVNGQETSAEVGKAKISINQEILDLDATAEENTYVVSVFVSSDDLKNNAGNQITFEKISENSSLVAVNPEKISNRPLLAESKSFFTSFDSIRKLVLPVMVVMFLILIALANTQPSRIE